MTPGVVGAARYDVELAPFTTLRLGGPARRFVVAPTAQACVDAVRAADAAGAPLLVLSGGSNLVIGDAGFDGTVVWLVSRGVRIDAESVLQAAAGEDWDGVVARTVGAGYGGLECLSGIPGSVGATPVQNVGAYGVELSDLLCDVELYDRGRGAVRTVPAGDLGLGYRTSVLKGTDAAVVLQVRLALYPDGRSAPIRYPELARALDVEPGTRVPAVLAREAVLELRRSKGMVLDPADHDTWSAGSFFTNPLLDAEQAAQVLPRIRQRVGPQVPQYPGGAGRIKLSAAWLIEQAGFVRGHPGPGGRTALSGKHTLALTNRGQASTEDLLTLAREVRDGVAAAFGITLVPEPTLVGCTL
ncbi:MAG TPA: UDP-N-acetylmuramate dehydrogenase [Pseudonocardiaceae bacterium]|jgi:UDP-N-acetylmuramate dehydrogenase|nr:UDP-N-acetylmuramate dehydrogenase [Pseudonocardiaceae bacterium]